MSWEPLDEVGLKTLSEWELVTHHERNVAHYQRHVEDVMAGFVEAGLNPVDPEQIETALGGLDGTLANDPLFRKAVPYAHGEVLDMLTRRFAKLILSRG